MNIATIKRSTFPNAKADALQRRYDLQGRALIEDGISQDVAMSPANKGRWPVGSVYSPLLQAVYGPQRNRRSEQQ